MRVISIFEYDKEKNFSSQSIKTFLKSKGMQINDVRIGKYIEIDYFSDSFLGEKIGEYLKIKKVEECELGKCNKTLQELVKDGRCWEAHEILEEIWHKSSGREKTEIHNIIKVCVAAVHYQRGNTETAIRLLKEALQSGINEELAKRLKIEFLIQKLIRPNEVALKDIAFGSE